MNVLGITGGIGAGKSTVSQILKEEYNAFVIKADDIAKELMQPGGATYAPLVSLFGEQILRADQTIDRSAMSDAMYSDPVCRTKVNRIVHPLVKEEIRQKLANVSAPLFVIEAALLKEGGLTELCDAVLCVFADEDVRIHRLMENRGYSLTKCRQIISSQKPEEETIKEADAVIDNSRSEEETRKQIALLMSSFGKDPASCR